MDAAHKTLLYRRVAGTGSSETFHCSSSRKLLALAASKLLAPKPFPRFAPFARPFPMPFPGTQHSQLESTAAAASLEPFRVAPLFGAGVEPVRLVGRCPAFAVNTVDSSVDRPACASAVELAELGRDPEATCRGAEVARALVAARLPAAACRGSDIMVMPAGSESSFAMRRRKKEASCLKRSLTSSYS